MRFKTWLGATAGPVFLAACGEAGREQAIFGAQAGSATAVVLDGNPCTGAVAGSAGNLLYCQTHPGQ